MNKLVRFLPSPEMSQALKTAAAPQCIQACRRAENDLKEQQFKAATEGLKKADSSHSESCKHTWLCCIIGSLRISQIADICGYFTQSRPSPRSTFHSNCFLTTINAHQNKKTVVVFNGSDPFRNHMHKNKRKFKKVPFFACSKCQLASRRDGGDRWC